MAYYDIGEATDRRLATEILLLPGNAIPPHYSADDSAANSLLAEARLKGWQVVLGGAARVGGTSLHLVTVTDPVTGTTHSSQSTSHAHAVACALLTAVDGRPNPHGGLTGT
jgi:hypothetical protein